MNNSGKSLEHILENLQIRQCFTLLDGADKVFSLGGIVYLILS